jgi:nucleotide-binding universal stress UspA family protein
MSVNVDETADEAEKAVRYGTHVRRILVGCSDSDASRAALRWATRVARDLGAGIIAAYAISTLWEWELAAVQVNTDPIRREVTELLDGRWTESLRHAGMRYRTRVVSGPPAQALMQLARAERVDLIEVGMGRHGTMSQLLLGTLSKDLLGGALCPVVAVPPD